MEKSINVIYPFNMSFLDYPSHDHCVVVYMMGCEFNCAECHNKKFKNPNYRDGTVNMDLKQFCDEIEKYSAKFRTNKVVLSGGDPLSKYNISFTKNFLEKSTSDVCIYTGSDVGFAKKSGLKNFKFLVCNNYDENNKTKSEKTNEYFQLASTNQEIIDANFNVISKDGKLILK